MEKGSCGDKGMRGFLDQGCVSLSVVIAYNYSSSCGPHI